MRAKLSCQRCRCLGAEMALGMLVGREHRVVARHLRGCASCRDEVAALTASADRLRELVPELPPPPGFEQRVLTALGPRASRPWSRDRYRSERGRRPRTTARARGMLVAAAVALAATITTSWLGSAALQPAPGDRPAAGGAPDLQLVRYAPLLADTPQPGAGQQVGQAVLYPGDPPWLSISLTAADLAAPGAQVRCEVVYRDGTVGTFDPTRSDHAHRSWAGPAPAGRRAPIAARLVDQAGHTLATARFAAPPSATATRPAATPTSLTATPSAGGRPPAGAPSGPATSGPHPAGTAGPPPGDHARPSRQPGPDAHHLGHPVRGTTGTPRPATEASPHRAPAAGTQVPRQASQLSFLEGSQHGNPPAPRDHRGRTGRQPGGPDRLGAGTPARRSGAAAEGPTDRAGR
jgi:hypothetical protein